MTRRENGAGEEETRIRIALAFLHGCIATEVRAAARGLNLPEQYVADRMAVLLHSTQGGESLRTPLSMPLRKLPVATAAASEVLQPKVAMADRTSVDQASHGVVDKRTIWWKKLNKKQKQEIIAKRTASTAKTMAAKKAEKAA